MAASMAMEWPALTIEGMTECNLPVLSLVTEAYPEAARFRDSQDRLPLHIAIEHGKTFRTGLKSLIQCYATHGPHERAPPSILEVRDVKTRLPPFLQAAASEVAPLETVFELLREGPELIPGGMNNRRTRPRL